MKKPWCLPLLFAPCLSLSAGFSDEARHTVSLMPQQAICTDSFMVKVQRSAEKDTSQWIGELQRADADANGVITVAEASHSEDVSLLFPSMDTDQSKTVTVREAVQFTGRMILQQYVRQFKRLDLDKSNTLTIVEALRGASRVESSWSAFDVDANDAWSFDEFMSYRELEDGVDLKGMFREYDMVSSR